MLARINPFNGRTERSDAGPFSGLDRLFETLARDAAMPGLSWSVAPRSLAPETDVTETEEALLVTMDLPGHDPKQIHLELEGDTLTIRSERKYERSDKANRLRVERHHGVFARSFVLPSGVDASRCEARFEQGVLTVSVPKREDAKPRTIAISVKS